MPSHHLEETADSLFPGDLLGTGGYKPNRAEVEDGGSLKLAKVFGKLPSRERGAAGWLGVEARPPFPVRWRGSHASRRATGLGSGGVPWPKEEGQDAMTCSSRSGPGQGGMGTAHMSGGMSPQYRTLGLPGSMSPGQRHWGLFSI